MADIDTVDSTFDILSNRRRRYVLHSLKKAENPMGLLDLAKEIARLENEKTIGEIPAEKVKHVHLSLYHHHIPKLTDANVVRYYQAKDTVALVEDTRILNEFGEFLKVK